MRFSINGSNIFVIYIAVASPSKFGFVAMITSLIEDVEAAILSINSLIFKYKFLYIIIYVSIYS